MSTQKTAGEKLAAYKKANKQARAKILAKSGYTTENLYLSALESNRQLTAKAAIKEAGKKTGVGSGKAKLVANKPTVHNVYILDASSSMSGGKFNNAVKGINTEISQLAKDDTVNYTQTLVSFSYSESIITHSFLTPINEVALYNPYCSGNTAMLQAIGQTLEQLMSYVKVGEKTLVKIFTDGQENDSRGKWSKTNGGGKLVSALIKKAELLGFTITFAGTDQDVRTVQNELSIDASNTIVHDNTAKGVEHTFFASTASTMSYASDVKAGKDVTRGFYKNVVKK